MQERETTVGDGQQAVLTAFHHMAVCMKTTVGRLTRREC